MTLPEQLHTPETHETILLLHDGQWHPVDHDGIEAYIDSGFSWWEFTDSRGNITCVPLDNIYGIKIRRRDVEVQGLGHVTPEMAEMLKAAAR